MKVIFKQNKKGEWRWNAIASNGRLIAEGGETYKRLAGAKKGFRSFVNNRYTIEIKPQKK